MLGRVEGVLLYRGWTSGLLPSAWTDVGQADPFVILSGGRAVSRFEDLLRLVKLIEDLKASSVKEIRPDV